MKKPIYFNPFFQILFAIGAGIVFGYVDPDHAMQTKPLGDLFITVIRYLVGPVIFCSVTSGIAAMRNVRELGEVGVKAFVYFELLSALALIAGLLGAYLLQPGAGFRLDVSAMAGVMPGLPHPQATSIVGALEGIVLNNVILQLLLCAMVCGILLAMADDRARHITALCDRLSGWLFIIVNLVLKAAPLAAFGAIAYTVGRYGLTSMTPLLKLVGAIYLTTALFAIGVFGLIARWCGFSLWRFVVAIKEELIIVIGTASSVAAMPRLIDKLRIAGCADAVTRVVVPAAHSFNLNGSNVYLTLALVFLAQASGIELEWQQYVLIFAVAMVTSKGSSGIAGSAFVVLTATLAVVPGIPASGLLFIVSIERLLKCRSVANIIGNGVACIAIASWSRQLDHSALRACCGKQ